MAGQLWATSSLGGYMSSKKLSKKLRYALTGMCKFRQFCDARDASMSNKHRGDTFTWNVYSTIATDGTTLTETNVMPESNFTINRKVVAKFSLIDLEALARVTGGKQYNVCAA